MSLHRKQPQARCPARGSAPRFWALILLQALLAASAWGQLDLERNDIELKRLDLHPRWSLMREIGSTFYGRVDIGLRRRLAPVRSGCAQQGTAEWGIDGLSRNYIGFLAVETLDAGWTVHGKLEHSFYRPLRGIKPPLAEFV